MNDYISNVHHTTHHQGEYVTHTSRPVTISSLHGSRILDSRGCPTIQVRLELEDGTVVTGDAPAGASTGAHEAVELRDGGSSYGGRDVSQALHLIATDVAPMITGQSWTSIGQVDAALAALDGTPNYRRLGANSVVATSIALARALAAAAELPLWRWIADVTGSTPRLPVPHFNVLNGGAHAANALDFQEFMIAPVNADTMTDAVRIGSDVYHALAALVRERFGSLGLGDEGGFAPSIAAPEEALDLLVAAISAAGYEPGVDTVAIALDPAANEFALGDGSYRVVDRRLDRAGMVDYYRDLTSRYPIRSIEDGFSEDDHGGWKAMSSALGSPDQIARNGRASGAPESGTRTSDPSLMSAATERRLITAGAIPACAFARMMLVVSSTAAGTDMFKPASLSHAARVARVPEPSSRRSRAVAARTSALIPVDRAQGWSGATTTASSSSAITCADTPAAVTGVSVNPRFAPPDCTRSVTAAELPAIKRTRTSGSRRRNSSSQPGSSSSAIVCDAATTSEPVGARSAATPASRWRDPSRTGPASPTTSRPVSVSTDPVVERCTNKWPTMRSATRIRADTACCVTPSAPAAAEKEPVSATHASASSVSRSNVRSVSRRSATTNDCAPPRGSRYRQRQDSRRLGP